MLKIHHGPGVGDLKEKIKILDFVPILTSCIRKKVKVQQTPGTPFYDGRIHVNKL